MSVLGKIAGSVLGTLAPTLATALGGPLAGMATAWIAKKVLGQENASLKDISVAMAEMSNPDMIEKIRLAEREFEAEMKRLEVDVFKLEVKDRDSAREFGAKSGVGAWMQMAVGAIIIGMFGYIVYRVMTGGIDLTDPNQAIMVGTLIGYVSSKADQVVSFLFGSSQGSKDKTDAMSNQLANYVSGKK
jgi:ABC-type Na+ efflux pump permease subunit